MKKLLLIALLICLLITTSGCYTPPNANVDIGDYNGNNFLSKIDNNTPLSQIALPGTHDSGATRDFFIPATARCQWMSISNQLNAGVRYMDIRLTRVNGKIDVYHGPAYQGLSFEDVVTDVLQFLEQNPSETLIMCIKEEGDAKGENPELCDMVKAVIDQSKDKWFTENRIPTLGEVRGKIVLMRRFWCNYDMGFDAYYGWADNTTFTLSTNGFNLACQDYYQDESADKKWEAIVAFLDQMKNAQSDTYYLNNTSGYIPGLFDIPNLNKICKAINPRLVEYLKTQAGIKGIIACDHITKEIAKEIIALNFK